MHAALEDMRDVSFCQEFDLVLNMAVVEAFCDYKGNAASPLGIQMIVHSRRNDMKQI